MKKSKYGFDQHPWICNKSKTLNKILTFEASEWFSRKENGDYESLGLDWGNGPGVNLESQSIDINECGDYSDEIYETWMDYISVFIYHWNNKGYRVHSFKHHVSDLRASEPLGRAKKYQYIKDHIAVFILEKTKKLSG